MHIRTFDQHLETVCSSANNNEASCWNFIEITTGATLSDRFHQSSENSMATGGEQEERFMSCSRCTVDCDPRQTLRCGHWYCFKCVVRLVTPQCRIPCLSCGVVDVLKTPVQRLPQFTSRTPAAARAERANAICESAAPQRVVVTNVTPRPPLADVPDERRRTETAQMLVRNTRRAHTPKNTILLSVKASTSGS